MNARAPRPTITLLNPSSGAVGTAVTITGSGFSTLQGSGTVTFNGTAAAITSWSALSIVTAVPVGATTGNVIVSQNGQSSVGTSFTVTSGATNCTPNVTLTAAAIQTALQNAVAGSTVCMPSGSLSVTTTIDIFPAVAANVTLMGQTTCTGAGQTLACVDGTTLTNNVGAGRIMSVVLPTTGVFRVSGVTWRSTICSDHPMSFSANSSYVSMRFDHSHWVDFCNINWESTNVHGVADHDLYENPTGAAGNNQVRPFGADNDTEWTNATNFGSTDFNWFYLEDSKWDRGIGNDCYSSGRQAFRYNYMNNAGIQEHGTGHSGQNRGCRGLEAYNNTIISGPTDTTTAVAVYVGSARVHHNTITFPTGTMMQLTETRQSNYTYTVSAQPSSYSYCGTDFNGAGSVFDGNTGTNGYPCLDQVGRGPGDLLSSDFTTKTNTTRGCTVNFTWANRGANCDTTSSSAWPRQVLEPLYEFLDSGTASGWINVYRCASNASCTPAVGTPNIVSNRDYYTDNANTNCNAGAASCTAGVGSGTLTQMPNSCTTGVGFWATDTNALYTCISTNAWRWNYSPYTYPHPIVGNLPVNNYATNFPLVENPVTEANAAGAAWAGGQSAGGNLWGNLQTVAGNIIRGATQPTTFGDPTGILRGTWNATQGAQAVVHTVGVPANDSEVEIRLRVTISANTITGYEAYCSAAPGDRYCHIASWGGANGSFSNNETTCFTETHAASSCPARNNDSSFAYVVDGDTLSATATGTNPVIIRLYINGVERERASDDGTWTFSTGGSHGPWPTGAPGVGFFSTTGTFTTHEFTKFSAFGQ